MTKLFKIGMKVKVLVPKDSRCNCGRYHANKNQIGTIIGDYAGFYIVEFKNGKRELIRPEETRRK